MLKSTVSTLNVSGRICNQLHFNVSNNPLSVQSVRWRKPIHLGTAKSKLFRVPPRLKEKPDERVELFRLNTSYKYVVPSLPIGHRTQSLTCNLNHFRTLMKSLKEHFRQENAMRRQQEEAVQEKVVDDHDFEKIKALNDAWNAKIAKKREIRLKKENEERESFILSRLEAKKEREAALGRAIDERVRKEMVGSAHYYQYKKYEN